MKASKTIRNQETPPLHFFNLQKRMCRVIQYIQNISDSSPWSEITLNPYKASARGISNIRAGHLQDEYLSVPSDFCFGSVCYMIKFDQRSGSPVALTAGLMALPLRARTDACFADKRSGPVCLQRRQMGCEHHFTCGFRVALRFVAEQLAFLGLGSFRRDVFRQPEIRRLFCFFFAAGGIHLRSSGLFRRGFLCQQHPRRALSAGASFRCSGFFRAGAAF